MRLCVLLPHLATVLADTPPQCDDRTWTVQLEIGPPERAYLATARADHHCEAPRSPSGSFQASLTIRAATSGDGGLGSGGGIRGGSTNAIGFTAIQLHRTARVRARQGWSGSPGCSHPTTGGTHAAGTVAHRLDSSGLAGRQGSRGCSSHSWVPEVRCSMYFRPPQRSLHVRSWA